MYFYTHIKIVSKCIEKIYKDTQQTSNNSSYL